MISATTWLLAVPVMAERFSDSTVTQYALAPEPVVGPAEVVAIWLSLLNRVTLPAPSETMRMS